MLEGEDEEPMRSCCHDDQEETVAVIYWFVK